MPNKKQVTLCRSVKKKYVNYAVIIYSTLKQCYMCTTNYK